jgi:hypothetical protein
LVNWWLVIGKLVVGEARGLYLMGMENDLRSRQREWLKRWANQPGTTELTEFTGYQKISVLRSVVNHKKSPQN